MKKNWRELFLGSLFRGEEGYQNGKLHYTIGQRPAKT